MGRPLFDYDEGNMMIFLKIMGFGFIIIVGVVFVINYYKAKEFPNLLLEDSLNDIVHSVETNRSAAYVTLSQSKKFRTGGSQNFQYEETNLSYLISPGDSIIKKPYSDTIKVVKKSRKEYVFVMNQTIQ